MLSTQLVAIIGIAYIFLLFLVAYFGDSDQQRFHFHKNNNIVYSLSLAVYCSSWTFYGAVGTAAVSGLDYLAIYLGPCLVFIFGYPLMRQIIMISKQNNITSVSDFISSRFGKSRQIAVLVTVIAVIGSIPYIALQLKAVSMSFSVLTTYVPGEDINPNSMMSGNTALYTGVILAVFTILFGTRHLDATEHHRGLILAISFESIVKLVAILAVGYYTVYLLLEGDAQSFNTGAISQVFTEGSSTWQSFLTKTVLSMSAIFLLPRQFQVMTVEAKDHKQFRTAMWVMPIYLLLTSIIVVPIALTGAIFLPNTQEDLYVLSLPLLKNNEPLALLAFVGGLSAATGMVIVAAISLSTMLCNDIVMPYLISLKRLDILGRDNLNDIILLVRRLAIVALIAAAYGYYVLMDRNANLANIGLVSFAAIIQFCPAVICALIWRRANSKGVFWGLVWGFTVWAYCLLLPTVLSEASIIRLFGNSAWLHPQALFGMTLSNTLTHGVFWSLLVNVVFLVYFSYCVEQSVLEKIQASRFYNASSQQAMQLSTISTELLSIHPETVRVLAERIIGVKNTDALFDQYEKVHQMSLASVSRIDSSLLSLVQKAIAGVIGSSSAQKVVTETLLGDQEFIEEVTTLVDETSSVLKFNRNLLQTTLENITHGISVLDEDMNLVIWNDRYIELFDYPEHFIYVGKPVHEVLQYSAQRGDFGDTDQLREINKRLRFLQDRLPYSHVRYRPNGMVVKSTGEPLPGGGFVTTYEDITESVQASEMLKKANEELEDRVHERTRKLEILTEELEKNTRSKTHFLAAASHDLLQPINAARLFAHSASEQSQNPAEVIRLAENIDHSLVTANHLLRALLDISKLDAGGITPKNTAFSVNDLFNELSIEFEEIAKDMGVQFETVDTSAVVNVDRQLLFSVLQNFIANALRYTPEGGRVLLGVRRRQKQKLEIQVFDTGVGIEDDNLEQIFTEFYRIKSSSKKDTGGLGLGLSIAKRIADLLGLPIQVKSQLGKGSLFSIKLPFDNSLLVPPKKPKSTVPISPTQSLLGVRVLCLDNDVTVLKAMWAILEGWGCHISCCESYDDAVLLMQSEVWDVILADYRLNEEKTGLDFLRQICNDYPGCGGVLITAEQDKSLKDQAVEMGFHYLAKPIEVASLKALMMFFVYNETSG